MLILTHTLLQISWSGDSGPGSLDPWLPYNGNPGGWQWCDPFVAADRPPIPFFQYSARLGRHILIAQRQVELAAAEHMREGSTAEASCKTLKALVNLKQLKKFHLQWPLPLRGTNEEVSELLSGMPHIEKLVLNSAPGDPLARVDMTLDVLPLIAKHCHSLRNLALFVDYCTKKGVNFSTPLKCLISFI